MLLIHQRSKKKYDELIQSRENPRRDVVHYESPPRKRLREQEDKVIKGYLEAISIGNSEGEECLGESPKGTVERLMQCKEEKEKRVANLRRKKALEELNSLREKPEICTGYKLRNPRVPLTERKREEIDFDEKMQIRRQNDPEGFRDPALECTFCPEVNRSSRSQFRSVNNLIEWGDQKKASLALRRIEKQEENLFPFAPAIDSKSKKLARQRSGNVEARLLEYASSQTERLNMLQKKMSESLFKPQISEKSRSLVKGKKEEETNKIQNGTFKNVDFWRVEPKHGDKLQLASADKSSKNSKSLTKRKQSMTGKENKSPGKVSVSPGGIKTKDPIPNYLSPYHKGLVKTDIPLKTLIERTNEVNQNIGTIGAKSKKKRISTRADVENYKVSRSNSITTKPEEINQGSIPLKKIQKNGQKQFLKSEKSVEKSSSKLISLPLKNTSPNKIANSKSLKTLEKMYNTIAEKRLSSKNKSPRKPAPPSQEDNIPIKKKTSQANLRVRKAAVNSKDAQARSPSAQRQQNISQIMQAQKSKREEERKKEPIVKGQQQGKKQPAPKETNHQDPKLTNSSNLEVSKKTLTAKIRNEIKLGQGVPLREVEDAKLWKNTKMATKIRNEEAERKRQDLVDTDGKPFNHKLELSEISLKKSQKKLKNLIYKDRSQLSEVLDNSCLSSVLSDRKIIKKNRFEEKFVDVDPEIGFYQQKSKQKTQNFAKTGEFVNVQAPVQQDAQSDQENSFEYVSEVHRDEIVEDQDASIISSVETEQEYVTNSTVSRNGRPKHIDIQELYEGGPDFCSLQD